jgi:hypothetical protein
MFKLNEHRKRIRFQRMLSLRCNRRAKLLLTPQHVKIIENTNSLSLGEKYQLILISLGMKLTTEIYSKINYRFDEKSDTELSEAKDIQVIKEMLASLPFPFYEERYTKLNRLSDRKREFSWFQVSLNSAVAIFVKDYAETFSEFEDGILYGYPNTAIRAFCGLIERRYQPISIARYFLAGVGSKDFWDQEEEYFTAWWNAIGTISPKLQAEGEGQFALWKAEKENTDRP